MSQTTQPRGPVPSRAPIALCVFQITVDGDTSTNDTVIGLASGKSGAPAITDAASTDGKALEAAVTALLQVGPAVAPLRWSRTCQAGHAGVPRRAPIPTRQGRQAAAHALPLLPLAAGPGQVHRLGRGGRHMPHGDPGLRAGCGCVWLCVVVCCVWQTPIHTARALGAFSGVDIACPASRSPARQTTVTRALLPRAWRAQALPRAPSLVGIPTGGASLRQPATQVGQTVLQG